MNVQSSNNKSKARHHQGVHESAKPILNVDDVVSLTCTFCEAVGGSLAMRLYYIALTRDWPRIYDLELPPLPVPADILVTQFLKKLPLEHERLTPERTAEIAFIESEYKCRETNDKFLANAVKHQGILYGASQIVASILSKPPSPEYHLDALLADPVSFGKEFGYFGINASVGNHGNRAALWASLDSPSVYNPGGSSDVSTGTASLLCGLYDLVAMRTAHISHVRGSLVQFVPKTGKTHRSICIEPTVNLYYQAALGRCVRDQLMSVGIDLRDQTRNQKLAEVGARTGAFATVDLSSASDTISYLLAAALLPEPWFRALDNCRTPVCYLPDGTRVELEKLSSMGNGFTFPIETLFFYAIAKATCLSVGEEGEVVAYGDDIIIPTGCYSLLVEVLNEFGFDVNTRKSFASGPYRESCGSYWCAGQEIRPVRLTEYPCSYAGMYRVCNAILAQAWVSGSRMCLDMHYRSLYTHVLGFIPKARRLTGPMVLDDAMRNVLVHDSFLMDPREKPVKPTLHNGWQETTPVRGLRRRAAYLRLDRFDPAVIERLLLYRQDQRRLTDLAREKFANSRASYGTSTFASPDGVNGVLLREGRKKASAGVVGVRTPDESRQVEIPSTRPGGYVSSVLKLSSQALASDISWM